MLGQSEVGVKDKHAFRRIRGLGVEIDVPDARRAVLREPDVATARRGLVERSRSRVRAHQRRELARVHGLVLEQLEQEVGLGVHVEGEHARRGRVPRVGTADECGCLEGVSLVEPGRMGYARTEAYHRAQGASDHGHAGGEDDHIANANLPLQRKLEQFAGDVFQPSILRACEFLRKDERAVAAASLALVNGPRTAVVEH